MKKVVIGLTLLLTITSLPAYSATPPKAGSACSKQGISRTHQGKKFTCIKSGKRLVWKKNGAIKISAPSATGIAAAAPAPLSTIKPIKSFSELRTRYLDFHYLAWNSAFKTRSKPSSTTLQIESLLGPNSRKCEHNIRPALEDVHKMFSGSLLPKRIWIVYFDEIDRSWVESETKKLLRQNEIQASDGKMDNPESVNVDTQAAVIWFENSCSVTDFMSVSGAGMSHGYTHSIQKFQFSQDSSKWGTWGSAPRWLLEGGATFSENMTAHGDTFEKWKSAGPFHNTDLKKYDLAFFQDFLRYKLPGDIPYTWAHTEKWPNQRVYDIGSIVCEILIAIQGPNSIIDLYREFAQLQDFDASFKKVFGVTWTDVYPDVAFAIHQFIQQTF